MHAPRFRQNGNQVAIGNDVFILRGRVRFHRYHFQTCMRESLSASTLEQNVNADRHSQQMCSFPAAVSVLVVIYNVFGHACFLFVRTPRLRQNAIWNDVFVPRRRVRLNRYFMQFWTCAGEIARTKASLICSSRTPFATDVFIPCGRVRCSRYLPHFQRNMWPCAHFCAPR